MSTIEHRPIRSFVLRQGRTSIAQQRAVDTLLPQWGIEYEPRALDLDATYGRHAPHVVEIGFGMGETTAAMAQAHPEVDYLGIEVHRPGVGNLLKLIDAEGLTNVRIVQHDAVEVLTHMIPPVSLDGLHLFFPDPWPKTRHHKRRLVQPPFVALIATRLKPGGYVHMATDWVDYAEQMLVVLNSEPALQNTATDYAPRPESRPRTKFESRGLRLGHDVRDLLFRRRPVA